MKFLGDISKQLLLSQSCGEYPCAGVRRELLSGPRHVPAACMRWASPTGSLGMEGGLLQAVVSATSSHLVFSCCFLPDVPASCWFLFRSQHQPQAARREPECLAGCRGKGAAGLHAGAASSLPGAHHRRDRAQGALPLPQRAHMHRSPQILTRETTSGCHSPCPGSWVLAVTLCRGGDR